jgi:hypothetical protein
MKYMTIVALGLLVNVAVAVANPLEPKEENYAFTAEVDDSLLESQVDSQR